MQPVLPSFQIPEKIEGGKAVQVSFSVVNDLTEAFSSATINWHLVGLIGNLASATFLVDIPCDGVSAETKLTLPSLTSGKYKLSVTIASNKKTLGENWYELIVH